jgi:hypothetical protein
MPEVTCINKTDRTDPWERIRQFGGPNPGGGQWRLAHAAMVAAVESNEYGRFYVERPAGDRVYLVVATSRFGNKYAKTEADGDQPNNLLSLPECT